MNNNSSYSLKESFKISPLNISDSHQTQQVQPANFFSIIDNSQFLSNFTADIIVGSALTFLVPFYLNSLRTPKNISFYFLGDIPDSVQMVRDGNDYICQIHPILKHHGGSSITNGIYWHLYFPDFLNVQATSVTANESPRNNRSAGYTHFYALLEKNLYKNTGLELPFTFNFRIPASQVNFQSIDVFYFFSTEFGYYPKKLKLNGGIEIYNTMGRLKILVEN